MFELIDRISTDIPVYALVFCRLSALAVTLPIISHVAIKARVRIMFAMMLTLIIAPVVSTQAVPLFTAPLQVALAVGWELLIGTALGLGARMVFEGFSMAGSFVGLQMGLGVVNIFDPTSQQQQSIISNLWMLVMLMFFVVSDSHFFLVEILYQNFQIIAPGSGTMRGTLGQTLVQGGGGIFQMAYKFAAPAVVFLLLIDVATGFVARVMPQMNVFFVSLPMKIGVGFFVLMISLRIFQVMFVYVLNELETIVATILGNIG